jgi:hypothetical protein
MKTLWDDGFVYGIECIPTQGRGQRLSCPYDQPISRPPADVPRRYPRSLSPQRARRSRLPLRSSVIWAGTGKKAGISREKGRGFLVGRSPYPGRRARRFSIWCAEMATGPRCGESGPIVSLLDPLHYCRADAPSEHGDLDPRETGRLQVHRLGQREAAVADSQSAHAHHAGDVVPGAR